MISLSYMIEFIRCKNWFLKLCFSYPKWFLLKALLIRLHKYIYIFVDGGLLVSILMSMYDVKFVMLQQITTKEDGIRKHISIILKSYCFNWMMSPKKSKCSKLVAILSKTNRYITWVFIKKIFVSEQLSPFFILFQNVIREKWMKRSYYSIQK